MVVMVKINAANLRRFHQQHWRTEPHTYCCHRSSWSDWSRIGRKCSVPGTLS